MTQYDNSLPWIVVLLVAVIPLFTKIIELVIEKTSQKRRSKAEFVKQQYLKKQEAYEEFLKSAGYAISNKNESGYNEMKRAQANALLYADEEMHKDIISVSGWVQSSIKDDNFNGESMSTSPIARLSSKMKNDLMHDYINCISK